MTQEIEIEYKNLLEKAEYEKLLDALSFPEQGKDQINYYFETADFRLKGKGAALRIREKNRTFQLTLKEPHPEGLLETHDTLTADEANAWLHNKPLPKEHTADQLNKLGVRIEDLTLYGKLTTNRRELAIRNVLLVLDFSTYNGQSDYELELEAQDRSTGERVFHELLKEFDIPVRKTPNKIERFFKSR